MFVPLVGYSTCRVLRSSARKRVYEVVRERDGRRAVAKVFRADELGVEARVRHEFRLLEALDMPGVVRALALERAGDNMVLLLDYVEGENLREHVGGEPVAISNFLPIAKGLAAILARVHARGVIHRDIKPSNILIEQGTGAVYLADFGISVLLEGERRHIDEPEILQGTLPYLAPEQTGRTRRTVDFRSDLYALGVTFYELLTARRPIEGSTPLELVHAHLARQPTPPRSLRSGLPEQLSAMVMKLLEKAPERRYQSARGLLADLERLEQALAGGRSGGGDFPLGQLDHAATLQFPSRLYGREREVEELAAQLRLVTRGRSRRVVYIQGDAGLGKSALIRSLEAPLAAARGYFAFGAFGAFGGLGRSGSLYAGLIQGFEAVLEQILTEDDAALDRWRRRLSAALGPIAGVVGELVPSLALVLGELVPAPPLAPAEARNRLHLGFARLLGGLCGDTPLVFVLDDLQWADAASLELIGALVRDEGPALLFVLASRAEAPAVEALICELELASRPVLAMKLEVLGADQVEGLLAEVLSRPRAELGELPRLVLRKTGNKPLLIRQFLEHLVALGLLEPSTEGWVWDAEAIARARIPEDALGLLELRLAGLAEQTRWLLCCAAHVGVRFDAQLLAAVSGLEGEALAAGLYTLESQGLIDRVDRVDRVGRVDRVERVGLDYHFAHEQLRVAAQRFAPPEASAPLHAAIGQVLLERYRERGGAEQLFEVADQLNLGYAGLALGRGEGRSLAGLNVDAGQRALDCGAWGLARAYFAAALERLGPELAAADAGRDAGDDAQDGGPDPLAFAARFGRAQTLALTGDIAGSEAEFEALLTWRLELVAHASVVARRVRVLILGHRVDEALAVGLAGLRRCGIKLPRRCSKARVLVEVAQAWRRCRSVTLTQWLARPQADDPASIAAGEIIDALESAAYLRDKNLFVVLAAVHLRVAAGDRLGPLAAVAISQVAIVVAAALRKPVEAAQLCDHALAVCERPFVGGSARVEARALLFVWPASRPWRDYGRELPGLIARLCEAGDRALAGFSMALGIAQLFEGGMHLALVIEQGQAWRAELEQWGAPEMRLGCAKTLRLALLLRGEGGEGGIEDLVSRAEGLEFGASPLFLTTSVICRMCAHTLLGRPEQAFAELEEVVDGFEGVLFGSWQAARFALWAAVVDGSQHARSVTASQRRRLRARMARYVRVLRGWAAGSPANFGAMLELATAEYEWVRGRGDQALAAYQRARSAAVHQANAQLEGLACLRMAALAELRGRSVEAHGARELALHAFRRWGARAVVAQLELNLGLGDPLSGDGLDSREEIFASVSSPSLGVGSSSSSASPAVLDLATVVETMKLISEDLHLDEVVGRVLDSAVTSAGADRGVLLLERDGLIGVVAEADGAGTRTRAEPVALAAMSERLPVAAINYVLRTGAALVLDDACADPRFASDSYIARVSVRSLLCMPIVKQSRRVGALLLENRLTSHGFPRERLELLRFLVAQAASALDNATLYAALQRSEARWRSLVSGAPDTILVLDPRGKVEFINHLNAGVCVQGLIGESFEALLDPSFHPSWRQVMSEAIEHGQTGELELRLGPGAGEGAGGAVTGAGEGERRWYMARVAPVEAAEGKLLVIATDISERKALEAQVRQHQRLESIGTLASGVAHEINNPIQGIMNYAELIAERAEGNAIVCEFAGEIAHESERVASIVRDLLAFSRQDREAALEWVAPRELVTSTLSLIQSLMRKDGVRIELDLPPSLPNIRCRPQQIQQIIMNLVTNARDALNERYGGFDERKRVAIRASERSRDGRSWLRIDVEDQGGGIPEAVLARIFDPFFTTKGRDKGTGLGLAVSHGIVVEHGGELTVESERGEGTVFHLLLPVGEEQA